MTHCDLQLWENVIKSQLSKISHFHLSFSFLSTMMYYPLVKIIVMFFINLRPGRHDMFFSCGCLLFA